jgi:DNA gyrase subunit A
MPILRGSPIETTEERDAYLRYASARRRAESADDAEPPCAPDEIGEGNGIELDEARIAALEEAEEFILSVASDGLGKRTSAYEYRVTARGGKGIDNMDLSRGREQAAARVVAAFPVAAGDQLVLVTDGGQLIRCPVDDIRIASRATRGVRLFHVAEDE